MLALPFPAIDPVLIEIGPFAIRWYALAYIAGLVLGWQYVKRLVQRPGWRLLCDDTVENHGHYYGSDLDEFSKTALIYWLQYQ